MKSKIIITDTFKMFEGEKFFQIKCLEQHKDFHAKRVIKKSELGGWVHESMINQEVDGWIERYSRIGAVQTEIVTPTRINNRILKKSNIINYLDSTKSIIKFWNYNCGVHHSHSINRVMTHSGITVDMMDVIIRIEHSIIRNQKYTDGEMITLWTILGAIQEAFLKVHATIFRKLYKSLRNVDPWSDTAYQILETMRKMNQLDEYDISLMSKIQGNRNLIHYISAGSPDQYRFFIQYIDVLFDILNLLVLKQKEYLNEIGSENYKKMFELTDSVTW